MDFARSNSKLGFSIQLRKLRPCGSFEPSLDRRSRFVSIQTAHGQWQRRFKLGSSCVRSLGMAVISRIPPRLFLEWLRFAETCSRQGLTRLWQAMWLLLLLPTYPNPSELARCR